MSLDHWQPPLAIAHRGSRLLWPENTMQAFRGAVDLGYRYLETDLHITADGVLVCIHDDTVDRTTDGAGKVADYTFDDLARLDAGFRHRGRDGHSFRGSGVTVPSLEEVATSLPDVRLIVDMKVDGLVDELATAIERYDLAERIIVGSFSDGRIAEFTEVTEGNVPTSTGPTAARSWMLTSRVGRGAGGTASALQLPTQMRGLRVVDQKLIETAHAKGLQVHVWTVNDRDEMGQLLDMGVDGIVTDRPDLLKEVLTARGQWS